MVRVKKLGVSSYERRRWLEQLESGKGITEISRTAGRDIRVVKRHIETAMEERNIAHARRDFLLGRLEQHQEDLLAEVRRLRQIITQYPPPLLVPGDHVQQKIHDALREHIKRLSLKGLLDLWEGATAEFSRTRENVNCQLANKEAELLSPLPKEVDSFPWTPALVEALEQGLPLDEPSGRTYASEKQGEDMYEISWGAGRLTRSLVSEAQVSLVIEAHKKLLSWAEGYRPLFQEHSQRFRELSAQVTEELDVFIIKRFVPGRCRYCPF